MHWSVALGLAASGITAGDEVIMADLNWIATAAPVVHLNAAPVFVDIDLANWCIDPLEVEKAITPKTKAIIVTHLYGNVAEINALREISREHSLLFVEDAAEALGSYHEATWAHKVILAYFRSMEQKV